MRIRAKEIEAEFRAAKRFDDRNLPAASAFHAERYLRADPKRGVVWFYYARSLYSMGRYPEALSALRRATRLCPAKSRFLIYREYGQLHQQRGAFRLAERWFRRAIAARQSVTTDYIYLGALLALAGRLSEAAVVHKRATRCKEGGRDEAFLNLGLVLTALGRLPDARKCFKRALALDPKYKHARKKLAEVEYVLERRQNV